MRRMNENEMVVRAATALAGTDLRKLSANDRRNMLISALAVLEAIKEPTEAMIRAGDIASDEPVAWIWRAMHAAMLADGAKS